MEHSGIWNASAQYFCIPGGEKWNLECIVSKAKPCNSKAAFQMECSRIWNASAQYFCIPGGAEQNLECIASEAKPSACWANSPNS